jgi:hypothetical protein
VSNRSSIPRIHKPSLNKDIGATSLTDVLPRPDAPYDLTDEEAQEWWAIVNRMPADYFPRETHGLLSNYCRLTISIRHLTQLIHTIEAAVPFDLNGYDRLIKLRSNEIRTASTLGNRLMITRLAQLREGKAVETLPFKTPWQLNDDSPG